MKKISLWSILAVFIAVFTLASCSKDADDYTSEEGKYSLSEASQFTIENTYLNNSSSTGVLVLQEGNMTTEDGFLNYLDNSNPATYYTIVGGSRLGSVAQDLYIHDGEIYIICQNIAGGDPPAEPGRLFVLNADDFTTAGIYGNDFSTSISNPTHIAVYDENTIYIRASGSDFVGGSSNYGVYKYNPYSGQVTALNGNGEQANPTRATPMTISNGYLFVCHSDGVRVYNASTGIFNTLIEYGSGTYSLVKSTDGNFVYIYRNGTIYEISTVNGILDIPASTDPRGTLSATISSWSNSAQISYYENYLFYANAGGAVYSFDISTGQNKSLGSITTGASTAIIGSVMYNGVAVDPGTGYLYGATTTYGNTYTDVNALNVFDVKNGAFTRTATIAGDERFTAGVFFPQNFNATVGTAKFDYVEEVPKYGSR
ncbi:MAG: hypothetical protein LUF90_05855 [Rikenellaceae bacterium]|nr:hypothetical protein [Rikenellaceae bacterium]